MSDGKIIKVHTVISKKLLEEIEYAHKNLKENERNKTLGKRKRNWTQIEASHELGKWLNSERHSNRKLKFVFEF
jgi:hypothetical protein